MPVGRLSFWSGALFLFPLLFFFGFQFFFHCNRQIKESIEQCFRSKKKKKKKSDWREKGK